MSKSWCCASAPRCISLPASLATLFWSVNPICELLIKIIWYTYVYHIEDIYRFVRLYVCMSLYRMTQLSLGLYLWVVYLLIIPIYVGLLYKLTFVSTCINCKGFHFTQKIFRFKVLSAERVFCDNAKATQQLCLVMSEVKATCDSSTWEVFST